jgi:cytidylate kinase
VFDKNLVEQVLEDHHLPKRLAQFMPEDRVSHMEDFMAELLGLRPSTWTLVHQTTETVLRLADLGHVILVGRGATVITRKLPQAFHVRLVGSLARRIARVQEYLHLDAKAAAEYVQKLEEGRIRYLRTHFHQNIDDPLLYHLIINTDEVPLDEATWLIGEAVIARIRAELEAPTADHPGPPEA